MKRVAEMAKGRHLSAWKALVRSSRYLLILACTAFAISLILFEAYDAFAFQPRQAEIAALLGNTPREEMNAAPDLRRLLLVSLNGHTASVAARQLLTDLPVPRVTRGMLGWHVTWALWTVLVALHMSESDQLRIFISTANLGDGYRGFPAASEAIFQRRLSKLSLPELATLVAMSHAPSLYSTSPDRLAERRDWLLAKIAGSTSQSAGPGR